MSEVLTLLNSQFKGDFHSGTDANLFPSLIHPSPLYFPDFGLLNVLACFGWRGAAQAAPLFEARFSPGIRLCGDCVKLLTTRYADKWRTHFSNA